MLPIRKYLYKDTNRSKIKGNKKIQHTDYSKQSQTGPVNIRESRLQSKEYY